jgi:cytochrome c biogenesis protein CcmG/thiol:disulfide interchange protein DsbE
MTLKHIVGLGLLAIMLTSAHAVAQKAPNFKLKAQDGKIVELAKLKGKVVVVNFWATWCGPCRKEIPGFMDVYNQYKSKGLEIVGVSLDEEGWDVVRPYLARMPIPYPVVVGDGALADAYGGIDAIPATFIIDKNGNIARKHIGYMDRTEFERIVKAML